MKTRIQFCILCTFLCLAKCYAQDFEPAETKNITLFPQQNAFRNTLNISGIWQYRQDTAGAGEKEQWFNGLQKSSPIAVPGSWNEQYDQLRNYMGLVWYEQVTYIPGGWKGQRIFIRVGAANYATRIWINGKAIGMHQGGSLPFAFEITNNVNWNTANRITIQVENILKPNRVPTGGMSSGGMFGSNPPANYDFFPYGGLQRPVWLYSVPQNFISDITVKTTLQAADGIVEIRLKKEGNEKSGKVKLTGNDNIYEAVFTFNGDEATATLKVPNARLWSNTDPYLYHLNVSLTGGKQITDAYDLPVGIRTISVTNNQLLLNGKPVYLKGFGKHEDFPIFGKGTAYPVIVKDYSLLKWVGANSYRTSHYPYDEEYMNMADEQGILIVDEIPAVGLYFDDNLGMVNERKEICKQQIRELVARDKNHPAVIIWSLANEPMAKGASFVSPKKPTSDSVSQSFFTDLFKEVKDNDNTRLATIVGEQRSPDEWLALSDIICINRYYGWYSQSGDIAGGAKVFDKELDDLHKLLNKPILVTEFGADTYAGMHLDQTEMFTEEYQMAFIKAYLDVANTKDFVCGMHVWAFADFKTGQNVFRFSGMNWKGVFTRDRKPKMAADYLHERWTNNSNRF